MGERKKIPTEIEAEVLGRSLRRCCLCFGLNQDLNVKERGQIAHLDRNPSNNDFDNLAYMCLDHHAQYDTRGYQSKGLTKDEVKRHRDRLYEAVDKMVRASWPAGLDVPLLDVPLLSFPRLIDPVPTIPGKGIQLTDKDVESGNKAPLLYISIYFKRSRDFGEYIPDENEKWLYIEADMRPAFNLRIQVRAWNQRDVNEFIRVLRNGGKDGWDLHGPRLISGELRAGDYFYVRQQNDEGEYRMTISTFTATNAAISIHARFSREVANALADYLESVGFTQ